MPCIAEPFRGALKTAGRRFLIPLSLAFPLTLPACSPSASLIQSGSAGRPTVEILTQAERPELRAERTAILPFGKEPGLKRLAYALCRHAHRTLLKARFTNTIDTLPFCPASMQEALEMGRTKGYDLVLILTADGFFYGGLNAESRVDLSLHLIDTRNGRVLLHVTGHMEGKPEAPRDYLVFVRDGVQAPCPHDLSVLILEEMLKSLQGETSTSHSSELHDHPS